TGPAVDPNATQGQWFRPVLPTGGLGNPESRSHEFYDNVRQGLTGGAFGGGAAGSAAIEGLFAGYTTVPGGLATGYSIRATIRNDTGTEQGQPEFGTNSHNEIRQGTSPEYVGTLFGAKLTTHWADDGVLGNFTLGSPANFASPNPAAQGSPGESGTFAVGYDELAWYSFTQSGAYQVPTWDFGDIPVGGSATRTLTFSFYTPVSLTALPQIPTGQDLFINRTTDLKIGKYFVADPVRNAIFDTGAPYPSGDLSPNSLLGNVSVFHNIPAPGAAALLALGGLVGLRRRR
ncbi:MAG: hypothetical protein K2V38_01245, partial [Gemmataceae bacterium]|nr:hypothetical protein [Gemmataceae bacterium]